MHRRTSSLQGPGIQLVVGRHLGMPDHMIARLTITTSSGTQTSDYTLFEMTTIGRAPDNAIVINNLHISKYHCTIELIDGEYFLHDHSLNGSWLNGVKLMPNACGIMLHHDDVRARAPCANNCAACP